MCLKKDLEIEANRLQELGNNLRIPELIGDSATTEQTVSEHDENTST